MVSWWGSWELGPWEGEDPSSRPGTLLYLQKLLVWGRLLSEALGAPECRWICLLGSELERFPTCNLTCVPDMLLNPHVFLQEPLGFPA